MTDGIPKDSGWYFVQDEELVDDGLVLVYLDRTGDDPLAAVVTLHTPCEQIETWKLEWNWESETWDNVGSLYTEFVPSAWYKIDIRDNTIVGGSIGLRIPAEGQCEFKDNVILPGPPGLLIEPRPRWQSRRSKSARPLGGSRV